MNTQKQILEYLDGFTTALSAAEISQDLQLGVSQTLKTLEELYSKGVLEKTPKNRFRLAKTAAPKPEQLTTAASKTFTMPDMPQIMTQPAEAYKTPDGVYFDNKSDAERHILALSNKSLIDKFVADMHPRIRGMRKGIIMAWERFKLDAQKHK